MAAFPSLSASFVLLQLALTCSAQHLNLTTRPLHLTGHTPGDGCVHLPIIHSTNTDHFARRGIQLALNNRSDVAYYAQLEIGTPPQTVYTQLDTGSFELWVNPDCTTVSPSDLSFCDHIGFYNASLSSTSKSLGTSKTLRYGIGAANISYVTDTISLSGSSTSLKDIQFGVATSSKDAFSGILGIGYGQGLATKYPNFIDQLYAQKITKVKAYTLALGSKTAQQGSIVFGGVDTSKFAGPLARLPIISAGDSPDGVPRFWVQMNGIRLTPPSGQSMGVYEGSKIPAFLDSGSTMTILPPALANKIAEDFGSPEKDANGFYSVGCGYVEMNGTMDFEFVGSGQKVTVRVPYKEMIREVGQGESKMCFLGIMGSESFTLLGDTFLRSVYATSCGNTPAALRDVTDLSRVVGNCQIQAGQKEAVVDVVSETSIAPPTGSTGGTDGVTGTGGNGNGNGGTRTAWGFVTTTLAVPIATGLVGGGGSMSATALDSSGRSMAGDVVLSVAMAVGAAVLGSLL
ncbi:hypothetical protein NEUTE1DRAFT_80655 [Neurospora tetrasperma FGSC 2508]|uniref:Peptidase A1 domain-containing protein n=1 Tax=Neurospora tetrasperma (strain FGSC 2508 / ATCC MYA-4615 / P0657) TaxID=510951 RepID=F8MN22_NEUT8|nr:uncharacterized protein NEUTE1DRAFT_80655 [Neurospora tetrasperma FGSC 2508]EGO57195.1 hypothetical protein NEUTE1DRAFT_80655 [Neurospora tetrasperma FGSC 2508]EGZ72561.1 acid protease [Neurospora tetrasperma FGSC 2509]